MTANEKIAALVATKNEIKGDAGRYWHCDPFTLGYIAQIDAEIAILEDDCLFDADFDPNVESKASLDYEARCNFEEDCIDRQDRLEIAGPAFHVTFPNDFIPF